MFKGTDAHPAGEFSAKVDEIGGNENAFTTADYTAYHQTVAKQHLGLMMEYEADRMANLVLDRRGGPARARGDPRGAPHRASTTIPARSSARRSAPRSSRTATTASRSSAGRTRWRSSTAPMRSPSTIATTRPTTPSSSSPATSTADEVKTLAEATYGKAAAPRRAAAAACAPTRAAEPLAARTVTLVRCRACTQPSLRRVLSGAVLCHRRRQARPKRSTSSSEILGGGTTSRLYRQLVVEQGMATSAGAGYQAARHRRYRVLGLRLAARRRDARDACRRYRRGDRRPHRQRRHRRGAGARQAPHHRRRRSMPRTTRRRSPASSARRSPPADSSTDVAGLAGPDRCGHRRPGRRCRQEVSRHPPFGHRLSRRRRRRDALMRLGLRR